MRTRGRKVKKERQLSMLLVLMIIIANVIIGVGTVHAQPQGKMYLEPASVSWESPPKGTGDTFTVEARITDVTDAYSIAFSLEWNASVLEMVGTPTMGDFLPGTVGVNLIFMPGTVGAGSLKECAFTKLGALPGETVSSPDSGLVATMTFQALEAPAAGTPIDTYIELVATVPLPTYWKDSPGSGSNVYDFAEFEPLHFTFEAVVQPPTPPTASFIYLPMAPSINETVTFDASASTSGYDGDTVTPITEYRWDFGDTDSLISPNPIVTHAYDAEGDYTVTLEVYAPTIGWADPAYEELDSVSKTVKVVLVVGLSIDLYSQHPDPYSGKGPDIPCDAFEPQAAIILCAEVTYNGDPVVGKLVSYKIIGPPNPYMNLTLERTAVTDADGVACVEFRLPWPAENAEEIVMGEWVAYATVSVAEMIATDTMPFKVGWLVETISIETGMNNGGWVPMSSFKKGECVGIKATVKNIAFTDKVGGISIVVYDDLGVPIAYYKVNTYTFNADIQQDHTIWCYLWIPNWAFLGVGTVYVNIFKDDLTGVPYCPEASVDFTIESAT